MSETMHTIDFFQWVKRHNLLKYFVLPVVLLSTGYFVLEQVNKRNEFADFRVYFDAAKALRSDTPMYHVAFGVSSGFYKYSPVAAVPFIPLTYLPFHWAAGIYYGLVSLAFVLFFLCFGYLLARISPAESSTKSILALLFLTVLFGADHAERELHLGNVNLFLMLITLLMLMAWFKGKDTLAGMLLGLVLLFKPHFLILLPYAVVKEKWKTIVATVAVLVAGFFLLSPFLGWDKNMLLYADWFKAMGAHNVKLETSPNTIYGLVNNGLNSGQWTWPLLVVILSIVALTFWIWLRHNNKQNKNNEIDGVEFALLLALIPTLSHTDTEHFMFSLPCVMYVLSMLLGDQKIKYKRLIVVLMTIAFVPFCVNSPDIIGPKMRYFFDEQGGLGLSNLLIIVSVLLVKHQQPQGLRFSFQ